MLRGSLNTSRTSALGSTTSSVVLLHSLFSSSSPWLIFNEPAFSKVTVSDFQPLKFSKIRGICSYRRTNTHTCTLSAALSRGVLIHKITLISGCPRMSLQSCCDRFLRKCLMMQRYVSTFGPAGGADSSMARGRIKYRSKQLCRAPRWPPEEVNKAVEGCASLE